MQIRDIINYYKKNLKSSKTSRNKQITREVIDCSDIKNHNILSDIEPDKDKWDDVKYLDLSYKNIKEIPEKLISAKNLRVINLSGNKIKSFEILKNFKHINIIILKNCELKVIPEPILSLKKLIILDLSHNNISLLPESLLTQQNLIGLLLSNNNINKIPDAISKTASLIKLNLAFNKINEFNKALWSICNLRYLNLGNNDIQDMEFPEIKNTVLNFLNLENNKIEIIDSNICNISALKKFNISSNQLKSIPIELMQLKKLDHFYFKDNPFNDMPELNELGMLNLFSYLNKVGNRSYEVEWIIPKEVKTAFQQYLIYFPEFVEKISGKNIQFDVLSSKKGIVIKTQRTSKTGIKEINDFLKQYLELLRHSKSDIYDMADNYEEKNIDYYKYKQILREFLREKDRLSEKIDEYFDKLILNENNFSNEIKKQGIEFQINYFESLSSDLLKIIKNNSDNILKQGFNVELNQSKNILYK